MPLAPKLAAISRNLPKVAKSQGFNARVTSGFRSKAKQRKLYELYQAGLSPYPVAVPGTSDHEIGAAIDVVSDNQDKLVSLLTSAGLFWAGPSDPIHFTMLNRNKAGGLIVGKYPYAPGESKKLAVPTHTEWENLTRTGKTNTKIRAGLLKSLLDILGL